MDKNVVKMSALSTRLGFWSALLFAIMGVGYGLGMGIFFMKYPMPTWSNIESFADFMKSSSQLFFSMCQITAFLSGIIFIILLCSIHEHAKVEKKIFTRIGMCFGTVFVMLASITYFVQFTVIPQNISDGSLQGLEQFVQLNTKSFISAIVILGWGLFLGLTTFFIAPVFSNGKLENLIKWSFILSGIFLVLNTIGYMIQNVFLCLISTGIYSFTLTLASVLLCILFRKLRNT